MSLALGLVVAGRLASVQVPEPPAVVEVEWVAPDGCPDRRALLDGVARRRGRPLEPGQARVVGRTTVDRADARRFRLELVVDVSGHRDARVLRAKSCAALVDAAALVIALAVDGRSAPSGSGGTDMSEEPGSDVVLVTGSDAAESASPPAATGPASPGSSGQPAAGEPAGPGARTQTSGQPGRPSGSGARTQPPGQPGQPSGSGARTQTPGQPGQSSGSGARTQTPGQPGQPVGSGARNQTPGELGQPAGPLAPTATGEQLVGPEAGELVRPGARETSEPGAELSGPTSRWRPGGFVRLHGLAEVGALPGPTGGVGLAGGLLWRHLRVELQAVYLAPRAREQPEFRAALAAGSALACARLGRGRLELPICAGLEAGALTGAGETAGGRRSAVGRWLAVTGGLGAAVRVHPRVAVWAFLQGLAALQRGVFALRTPGFDLVAVFDPGIGSGRLALGVELRFGDPR